MQKAESLSFQTVLGLEGRGQSLINEISIRVQSLRSWFLRSINVIWKLEPFFEIMNRQPIPTWFSTERKTISRCDEMWFVGVSIVTSCDLLVTKISNPLWCAGPPTPQRDERALLRETSARLAIHHRDSSCLSGAANENKLQDFEVSSFKLRN